MVAVVAAEMCVIGVWEALCLVEASGSPFLPQSFPSPGCWPDSAVYFADLNGDRRADIILKEKGKLGAYYNGGINASKGVNWDFDPGGYIIGIGWNIPDSALFFADLTGEGRADIIGKDTGELRAFYNNGITPTKGIYWDYAPGGYVISGGGWNAFPDSSVYMG